MISAGQIIYHKPWLNSQLKQLLERAQECYLLGPTSLIGCFKDNGHIIKTRVFHKALEEIYAKQTNAHTVMPVDT